MVLPFEILRPDPDDNPARARRLNEKLQEEEEKEAHCFDIGDEAVEYSLVKELGSGTFGKVYQAINKKTGASLAVKVVQMSGKYTQAMEKTLNRELGILHMLDHPNIVRFYGIRPIFASNANPSSSPTNQPLAGLHIVMEFVSGNSLRAIVDQLLKAKYAAREQKANSTFTIPNPVSPSASSSSSAPAQPQFSSLIPLHLIRSYTAAILDALAYAHAKGVVHRDIKAANILLTSDSVIKVADWGSAKIVTQATLGTDPYESLDPLNIPYSVASQTYHYSPLWMAPEVPQSYNHKVDIWAVGCVILELLTGRYPWQECGFQNPYQAMHHIVTTKEIPAIPPGVPQDLLHFLHLCFQKNPEFRPEAKQLLQHPFITGDEQHLFTMQLEQQQVQQQLLQQQAQHHQQQQHAQQFPLSQQMQVQQHKQQEQDESDTVVQSWREKKDKEPQGLEQVQQQLQQEQQQEQLNQTAIYKPQQQQEEDYRIEPTLLNTDEKSNLLFRSGSNFAREEVKPPRKTRRVTPQKEEQQQYQQQQQGQQEEALTSSSCVDSLFAEASSPMIDSCGSLASFDESNRSLNPSRLSGSAAMSEASPCNSNVSSPTKQHEKAAFCPGSEATTAVESPSREKQVKRHFAAAFSGSVG